MIKKLSTLRKNATPGALAARREKARVRMARFKAKQNQIEIPWLGQTFDRDTVREMAGSGRGFWDKAVEAGYDPLICQKYLRAHSRVFGRRGPEKLKQWMPWLRGAFKFACEAAEEYWGENGQGDLFKAG